MGDRKRAMALAKEGETLRLMATQNQDVSVTMLKDFLYRALDCFDDATRFVEKKQIDLNNEILGAESTPPVLVPNYPWALAHWGATASYLGATMDKRNSYYYRIAEEKFQAACALKPRYAWAWANRGQNLCWWGIRLSENDRTNEAISKIENEAKSHLDKAISYDEKYTWAFVRRAIVHRMLGLLKGEDSAVNHPHFDDAINDLENAIKLNYQYASAYGYLAVLHRQKARAYDAAAIRDLQEDLSNKNKNNESEALDYTKLAKEEWKKVYNSVEQATKIDPRVFLPPKMLKIGYMYLPAQGGTTPTFLEESALSEDNKYTRYTAAALKAHIGGDLAAKEDIDRVLAEFAGES
ncbi:MAG: hypothetical protein J7647_29815 [Cyanobacteria bacterium SBLK]|nr:hypothetical protein [Cyanobacteria bacterium SBLK]